MVVTVVVVATKVEVVTEVSVGVVIMLAKVVISGVKIVAAVEVVASVISTEVKYSLFVVSLTVIVVISNVSKYVSLTASAVITLSY